MFMFTVIGPACFTEEAFAAFTMWSSVTWTIFFGDVLPPSRKLQNQYPKNKPAVVGFSKNNLLNATEKFIDDAVSGWLLRTFRLKQRF